MQANNTLPKSQYTAKAVAEGAGRNGTVKLVDEPKAPLTLKLAMPPALGGSGEGQNPEQLFALGYACTSDLFSWSKVSRC